MKSNKIIGIVLLLIYVCVATALLNDSFIRPYNLQNMLRSSSMFAIIGIGAVLVIVTGGIDLSTGSLIGLVGCTMTMTIKSWTEHPPAENGAFFFYFIGCEVLLILAIWLSWNVLWMKRKVGDRWKPKAILLVLGICTLVVGSTIGNLQAGDWLTISVAVAMALLLSMHLGFLHGVLITKLGLQPFVVTLCGLMCYRGLSRWLTVDTTQGFGTEYNDSLRLLAIGKPCTATFVMMCGGGLMVLFGMWKAFFAKGEDRGESRVTGLTVMLLGLVLAVVCSSRYWNGWEVQSGETLATIGSLELKLFTLELPDQAAERPAKLMEYSLIPMLASFVGLLVLTIAGMLNSDQASKTRDWLEAVAPAALVVGSIAVLLMIKNWIGDEQITLAQPDNTTYYKMAGIFLSMAALMGSVVWLGKSWTANAGTWGKVLWLSLGFFAILWLLSKTAITETIVQTPFFFLVVIGLIAAIFLNKTVAGRYLQAVGSNEEAARFSGIGVDNTKIMAYTLCALCGGIGAVLFTLDSNNVEPSGHGSFYELYAIAAAVLGGCSLRGGEGSILGVIIGATIMRVLYNAPDMIGISSQLEMFTIGIVLLIGVIVDEMARKIAANRDRKRAG